MRRFNQSVLSVLLAGSLVFSAAGCRKKDDKETRSSRGGEEKLDKMADDTVEETEATTTKQLDAPSGLFWDYVPDLSVLTFSWNAVAGAKAYEYCVDNGTAQTTTDTKVSTIYISNKTGTLQVRAVDGDNKSGWSNVKYDISVYPDAPTDFHYSTYGKYELVYWQPVTGADSYEVKTSASGTFSKVTKPYALINMKDGASATIEIRACSTSGTKQYNSALQKVSISHPVVDLNQVDYFGSCVLDYYSLIEWIKMKNLSYSTDKANGDVYVIVSMPDNLNSGFFNALGRAFEAFVDAWFDNIPSALEDNLVDALLEGQKPKDYLKSSAKDAGKSSILTSICAAFSDTSINFIYRYNEQALNAPADDLSIYMLKNNRSEQLVRDALSYNGQGYWGQSGRCFVYTPINDTYGIGITEGLSEDGKYWVIDTHRADKDKNSPIAAPS